MNHSYYKKIDRSLLEGWVIIIKEYENDFLNGENIAPSTSRNIKIKYKNKSYKAKLHHVNRKGGNNVYQLRWDSDKNLLSVIRKDFINSYVILKSQKELHENISGGLKKFRGHMDAGNQEVIALKTIHSN